MSDVKFSKYHLKGQNITKPSVQTHGISLMTESKLNTIESPSSIVKNHPQNQSKLLVNLSIEDYYVGLPKTPKGFLNSNQLLNDSGTSKTLLTKSSVKQIETSHLLSRVFSKPIVYSSFKQYASSPIILKKVTSEPSEINQVGNHGLYSNRMSTFKKLPIDTQIRSCLFVESETQRKAILQTKQKSIKTGSCVFLERDHKRKHSLQNKQNSAIVEGSSPKQGDPQQKSNLSMKQKSLYAEGCFFNEKDLERIANIQMKQKSIMNIGQRCLERKPSLQITKSTIETESFLTVGIMSQRPSLQMTQKVIPQKYQHLDLTSYRSPIQQVINNTEEFNISPIKLLRKSNKNQTLISNLITDIERVNLILDSLKNHCQTEKETIIQLDLNVTKYDMVTIEKRILSMEQISNQLLYGDKDSYINSAAVKDLQSQIQKEKNQKEQTRKQMNSIIINQRFLITQTEKRLSQ